MSEWIEWHGGMKAADYWVFRRPCMVGDFVSYGETTEAAIATAIQESRDA